MKKCFLLLVVASMAVASGCSSEASSSNDAQPDNGAGVVDMTIDKDSGE